MSAAAIDTAIAALSVSITSPVAKTLAIKSLATMPNEVQATNCPMLFPAPSSWLGQSSAIPGNFDNAITGRIQYTHNLSYVLAYDEVGTNRGLYSHYAGMAALLQALVTKIMRIDTLVATSIRGVTISAFGQVSDPSDKPFYGVLLTVNALEYVP